MKIKMHAPSSKEAIAKLNAGDLVLIEGTVYTARDAAHKRMVADLQKGLKLPFDIKDQFIYYAGPAPKRKGDVIGSVGPTTSGRMDIYTPLLLDNGLLCMLGKGFRSSYVREAIVRNTAAYIGLAGGAGAFYARRITSAEIVAYEDLGPEAIYKLTVVDFPGIVLIDSKGNDLYDSIMAYKK